MVSVLLMLATLTSATKIRGVNLGGWLVVEPWITPKLFMSANEGVMSSNTKPAIVDEFTWRSAPAGKNNRTQILLDHWREWVTEDIIDQLHQAGITHLRVPVGYWYFNMAKGDLFEASSAIHPVALAALQTMANQWAKPRGMQVLLDLHTAPGSQDGFGEWGPLGNSTFGTPENFAQWQATVQALFAWAEKNIDSEVLFGVEVLTEPVDFNDPVWEADKAYVNPNEHAAEPTMLNVWADQNTFQCFGQHWDDLAGTDHGWETHLSQSCEQSQGYAKPDMAAYAGEWSLATTDCTIFLGGGMNKYIIPDCKDNATQSQSGCDVCQYSNKPASKMSDDYTHFLSQYAHAQMDALEHAGGWFFSNFRTEEGHAPEWDYLLGWQEGWMPKSAGDREPHCSSSAAKIVFV